MVDAGQQEPLSRRERLKRQREERILDAAAAIFAEQGYHQATIHDVAVQADVADGTIYNYYDSKFDLLIAILSRIAELEQLRDRYKFASFMFHDDCLTENREWVLEFCDLYEEHGFTQPFFCQSRADIIVQNEDMVQRMAEVGLTGYFIGFESGNARVLNFLRKGTTPERNLEAARVCRRYGLAIWANYMLGIPTETQDEVMDTVNLIREIDPDYYSPSFFTPHPGTDLYDYCIEHDLSLITDYDSYRRNPTEPKIKGQDYDFLMWARDHSQQRLLKNRIRRRWGVLAAKYTDPSRYARKMRSLLRLDAPQQGDGSYRFWL